MYKKMKFSQLLPVVCLCATSISTTQWVAAQESQNQTPAAQEKAGGAEKSPSNVASNSEVQFLELLDQMQKFLATSPSFQLKIEKKNSSDAVHASPVELILTQKGKSASGTPEVRLSMKQDDTSFVVDWDGKTITRWLSVEKLFSKTASADLRQDLRRCQFTNDLLSSINADFLLQPDLAQYIQHQAVHVRNLGNDEFGRHFQMELSNNKKIDLWFDKDASRPLPVLMKSASYSPTSESKMQETIWESQFAWDFAADKIEIPMLQLPEGARQVDSILEALLGEDTSDLLNKVVPAVKVVSMDGKQVDLKEFATAGSKPTLLYFWATWAAPSLREMESVKQYASSLRDSGIRIQTINVAESAKQVSLFRTENKLENEVWMDQDGAAAKAFSIAHLPSAVVIDQQGIIRGIFENVGNQNREEISEMLKSLLRNE